MNNEIEKESNVQKMHIANSDRPVQFYSLDVSERDILRAVSEYTEALMLLDQYDHQAIGKPKGTVPSYRITYDDGCKRIAASLFLEFLDRNNALFVNEKPRLGQGELAALTLLIAESNPEEKEVMTMLTMNLLQIQ